MSNIPRVKGANFIMQWLFFQMPYT